MKIHAFFISNTFTSNASLKLAKNQANAIHILHPHFHPKIIGRTLKNKQNNSLYS